MESYFDAELIKACIMEKPAEDALWQYARENRCPRCNARRLQTIGEVKGERGPIGIIVCRDCEFGIYVESTAQRKLKSIEQIAGEYERWAHVEEEMHQEDDGDYILFEDCLAVMRHAVTFYVADCASDMGHLCEMLEAVEGYEEFGDLVLRLLKDRDRLQEALVFYAKPEHYTEPVPDPEIEQNGAHTHVTLDAGWKARDAVGPQVLGMKQPEHPGLDIVKDKPATLVVGARILARALDRPVYLTRLTNRHGGIAAVLGPWTITIERDRYGSHVAIEPDGSALACEVLT